MACKKLHLKVMLFIADCLIGSGGSVTSSNNDSSRQEVPTVGVAEHDIPKLSVMFNRQKYYSRLVHPSDNRMVKYTLITCFVSVHGNKTKFP